MAEERRAVAEGRAREATSVLVEKLTQAQAEVEQRLAGWSQDLERGAEAVKGRIAELDRRSADEIGAVLDALSEDDQQRLVAAMDTVHDVLTQAAPAAFAAASDTGATSSALLNRNRPLAADPARPHAPAMANAAPSERPSLPAAAFHSPPRIPAMLQRP